MTSALIIKKWGEKVFIYERTTKLVLQKTSIKESFFPRMLEDVLLLYQEIKFLLNVCPVLGKAKGFFIDL